MMLEGAGFEVIDLGINTDVDEYWPPEEHKPDIFGMSALLTTTMPYMKVVIDTMAEQGIRDDYIVLVGGAPLNQEFGDAIGADAYCRDAAVAAETAPALVQKKRQTHEPASGVVPRLWCWREGQCDLELNQGLAEVEYLCISHNRPERISDELRRRLALHASKYDRILWATRLWNWWRN